MSNTWVVVAESSRARIFELHKPGGEFTELADLVHPQSRLKDSARLSDSPGRTFNSQGRGKHTMSPETDPRRHEGEVFASEIAHRLEAGRTAGKYDKLILAAPPEFLGLVRASLNTETAGLVGKTINKNIVRLKPGEIREHLEI